MGASQDWKASAIRADASERLLCQAGSLDYVMRWCRHLLKTRPAQEQTRFASIALFRWEARARARPGWKKEQEYLPPFAELLVRRRKTRAVQDTVRKTAPLPSKRVTEVRPAADTRTAFSELDKSLTLRADPGLTARYEKLLAWLSAAGAGRWGTFLHVCQVLSLAGTGSEAARVARRLVLLGHLELSESGTRWSVMPPTLTPLADEPDRSFLRGQRTLALLANLPIAREETSQPDGAGPSRVVLLPQVSDSTPIEVGTSSFHVEPRGAAARAEGMPTWQEWLDRMLPIRGLVLTKFQKERWHNSEWTEALHTLFEDENHNIRGDTGLYRLSREQPFRSTVCVFFDSSRQKLVRGDWYGLRFLARRFQGLPLTARWHADLRFLSIPHEERWPLEYEKVLIQASGLLPCLTSTRDLYYEHMTESLVRCLCRKLEVNIVVVNPDSASTHLLTAC
jgi:hypothetical protein